MQKRKNISMKEIQDYVENRLSPNHKAEIDHFLAQNPEDKEALMGYQKYISLGGTRKMWDGKMEISKKALFSYVEKDIRIYWANQWEKVAKIPKKSVQVAAACCLFVFGGAWAWPHIQNLMQGEQVESSYTDKTSPFDNFEQVVKRIMNEKMNEQVVDTKRADAITTGQLPNIPLFENYNKLDSYRADAITTGQLPNIPTSKENTNMQEMLKYNTNNGAITQNTVKNDTNRRAEETAAIEEVKPQINDTIHHTPPILESQPELQDEGGQPAK